GSRAEAIPAVIDGTRQLVLHDPLARRPLEARDHRDITWVLVGCEPRAEPGRERCGREALPTLRLYEQLDVLLADLRGDADHGAVLDRGMRRGDALDLPGRDILAPASHAVGHAAEKGQIPLGIEGAEVASVQRAIAERAGARRGIPEIAGE